MSKKMKKAMLKAEYDNQIQLMDDLYEGNIDYGKLYSKSKHHKNEYDDNDLSSDVLKIFSTSNDNRNTDELEKYTHSIDLEEQREDADDDLIEYYDEDDVEVYDSGEGLITFDDEDSIIPEVRSFMSFGCWFDNNVATFTDGIKSISIDLNTIRTIDDDIVTKAVDDVVIDFLTEVLPRFYPSGIYSKVNLENTLKGLKSFDINKFRFYKEGNIIYGYFISDGTQETLMELFNTIIKTKIYDKFIQTFNIITESEGFNFNLAPTDFAKTLFTNSDFTSSSLEFINTLLEDDKTVVDKTSDINVIFDNTISLDEESSNDEVEDEKSNTEMVYDETNPNQFTEVVKDSDESLDESDKVTESENIEEVEDDDTLSILDDSETDIEEPEELSEDEEIFDSESDEEIAEKYGHNIMNTNRDKKINNKYHNKGNNSSDTKDDSMIVSRFKK